jgi:hypothetical protein
MSKLTKAEKKNLAPNDPRRVPQAHRDLVQKMFNYCKEKGYNVSQTETLAQSLSLLKFFGDAEKFLEGAQSIKDLAELYVSVSKDIPLLTPDLQLLGQMMTEMMNSMSLKDMEFKKI